MHNSPNNEAKRLFFLIHIRNLSHFEQPRQDKKTAKEVVFKKKKKKGKSERRLIL